MLLQQEVIRNNDLHQESFSPLCLPQSTAVLCKYLNDEQKLFCLLQFFPDIAQNCLMIP